MPRKAQKLYVSDINKLKPKDKVYSVNAGGGLILRVKTTGVKTWVFNYYSPITESRTNFTIGNYPSISISDAEQTARDYKELVRNGKDPKRVTEQLRREQLANELDVFSVYAEKYFAIKRRSLKESTIKKWERYLEKDVLPVLGNIPVNQIHYSDGVKVRDSIIARGSFDIARKVCNYMNQIMLYTNVKPNPFEDLTKNLVWPDSKNQKSISTDRLPDLMKAIQYSNTDLQTRLLIEFQLHTMVRPREAAIIEWADIDFDNAVWTIPANKRKGRKGKELQHRVPLSKQTIEILEMMKHITGRYQYVFTSKYNHKTHVNVETANKALQRTSLKGQIVAHGFRTLAKTTLEEIGKFEHLVCEAALSHKISDQTKAAYTRTDYFERRIPLMQWWSDRIEEAKTGKIESKSNVSDIRFAK
ncbi:MAG: integrase arm-type DNA-binding domain-containing protein [Pseudomonadota bacterium]|nr:integrase arm-type DNA-binding domain-containing protein [Pseudomonadota bacterium]